MPLFTACGGGGAPAPAPAPTPAPTPAPATSEFDVVKDTVAAYLADKAGNVNASDLQMKIAEEDAPYIVSIRTAENYAAGHIPGAVNSGFAKLATLPKDEEILIYCYTGQSASFGAAVLGVLGYDVQNLKFGMSAWSTDPDVYVKRFNPDAHQGDFKIETAASTAKTYGLPKLDNTASNDAAEIVKAAAATISPKYIDAADLNMKIAEDEDMTILSIRSAEHYAAGHIPGAINAPFSPALVDALDKLNPDAPVYVYCYTGHSAAQATALLQMLGYDAYSLKFGMCSWTGTEANAGKCFNAASVQGYGTEK